MFPEAVAAMSKLLAEPGNPSSLHASGRLARRYVEEAREQVAHSLGAGASEIVFTSGGTEADNIAVKGIAWQARSENPAKRRVVISAIEHHAVLDPAEWLESDDFEVTWIQPDSFGRITPELLRAALGDDPSDVAVVSVMLANNEVGTINDIKALVAVAKEFGICFHTDAVQAPAWLKVDHKELGVCAISISGHKVGGPHGVGALVVNRDCKITPLIHGGGQERDVRSGTLDTPAIVSLAQALQIVEQRRATETQRIAELRDYLVVGVKKIAPDAVYNGDPENRLSNNAHFTFPSCLGDSLLMLLDAQGVECSVGSACNAGVPQPSHVLLAMGASQDDARSTLRFTLGYTSTKADVDELLVALPSALERARKAGMPKL
jgi:cysteine desulfurase